MNMNNPTTIWTIFFATAALTGATIEALGRLIWRMRDMGRAWIVTVPTTIGAMAKIERRRLQRGTTTDKAPNGDEHEITIHAGDAAYPTKRGPLHIKSEYGANLVAPTKEDATDQHGMKLEGITLKRFRIWDPQTYWRATRENDMEDLYAAQREKDHWAIKLAPVAIILFIGLMGFMAFLLWKILPLIQHAAG